MTETRDRARGAHRHPSPGWPRVAAVTALAWGAANLPGAALAVLVWLLRDSAAEGAAFVRLTLGVSVAATAVGAVVTLPLTVWVARSAALGAAGAMGLYAVAGLAITLVILALTAPYGASLLWPFPLLAGGLFGLVVWRGLARR